MKIRSVNAETTDILAPAGNRAAFLAAVAAGADAVYCGLKQMSARMAAKNFTIEELIPLAALARRKGIKVYITLNSLLTPEDLDPAMVILWRLCRRVKPDALIIQDLAWVQIARQAGFNGELHLSTLANVSFPGALQLIKRDLGVHRVVIPRELNIDEIKRLTEAAPQGLDLEVFVHGALCYAVSGRCYWSSFMGGKSGLRGRCVQPCRRYYDLKGDRQRFFSCRDLSLDVLVKVLAPLSKVRAWKIEGRKKNPHYVYHTVSAYRMLRDRGADPAAKKSALSLLDLSLGRKGTHYNFLPQRPQNPVEPGIPTGSGLLVGRTKGTAARTEVRPRIGLLSGDTLRIGYEDDPWHALVTIRRSIPPHGRFQLKLSGNKTPAKGTPVFLTDRRQPALMAAINALEKELLAPPRQGPRPRGAKLGRPRRARLGKPAQDQVVYRKMVSKNAAAPIPGIWLSKAGLDRLTRKTSAGLWYWLPPVIWPRGEDEVRGWLKRALALGGGNFVINSPWQAGLFPAARRLNIWAGPFCNLANSLALKAAASLGCAGVIVSPELSQGDYLRLPATSPLPLGIVVTGLWPLCVSRIKADGLALDTAFTSPRGEQAWTAKYGPDYWVYPNWQIDLRAKRKQLQRAGYRLFVEIREPVPKGISLKKRAGLWNWKLGLK